MKPFRNCHQCNGSGLLWYMPPKGTGYVRLQKKCRFCKGFGLEANK